MLYYIGSALRYCIFAILSLVIMIVLYSCFILFFFQMLLAIHWIHDKTGTFLTVLILLFGGLAIFGSLWELFKRICGVIVILIFKISPSSFFADCTFQILAWVGVAFAIYDVWKAPESYNGMAIMICILGTIMALGFAFAIGLASALAKKVSTNY